MKHLKLHAKMLLADGDPATVLRLQETAERDWASSYEIDHSDAGLLHDL